MDQQFIVPPAKPIQITGHAARRPSLGLANIKSYNKNDSDNKIKELLDKNNRIMNNILEKTIENNKLNLQLQDITELYKLLLTKETENKLKET